MHPFVAFMIIWAVSILITMWMMYYIVCNVIKDFANNGLLLNSKKMSSFGSGSHLLYWLFIPIANLFFGLYFGMQYSKSIRTLAATSSMIADPMTEEQKKRWEECPKAMTAFSMIAEKDKEEQNAEYKAKTEKKMEELKNNIEELKKEENNED